MFPSQMGRGRIYVGKLAMSKAEDDVRKTMEVFADVGSKDTHFTYRYVNKEHDVLPRINLFDQDSLLEE